MPARRGFPALRRITILLITAIALTSLPGPVGTASPPNALARNASDNPPAIRTQRAAQAPAVGEVTLTATAGSPTGSFTNLKGAFDAINAGTHQGVIAISINADTTELSPAVLFASGTGASSYTSITIQPSGGAPRTVSGAATGVTALIDLNGA